MKISPSKLPKSKSDTLVQKDTKSRSYRIKSVSDKKLAELKEYRVVRDKYLKGKVCEYPNCTNKDVELHHAKGRVGALLTDERYFKALCRGHHRLIEEQPSHAKELGLSFSRLDKEER